MPSVRMPRRSCRWLAAIRSAVVRYLAACLRDVGLFGWASRNESESSALVGRQRERASAVAFASDPYLADRQSEPEAEPEETSETVDEALITACGWWSGGKAEQLSLRSAA